MADQNIKTNVTAFMKSLTQTEYDAILNDVNDLIEIGKQAIVDLANIISKDSNNDFKNKFNNLNSEYNGFYYFYDFLKNGLSADLYGVKLNPGLSTTKDSIKKLYNEKISLLEKAGNNNGRPKYNVTINGTKTILFFDSNAFYNIYIYDTIYDTLARNDVYAAKAVSDYMFRIFLKAETFTTTDASQYITNFSKHLGITNVLTYSFRQTLAGTIAALESIKEKLENYTVRN